MHTIVISVDEKPLRAEIEMDGRGKLWRQLRQHVAPSPSQLHFGHEPLETHRLLLWIEPLRRVAVSRPQTLVG